MAETPAVRSWNGIIIAVLLLTVAFSLPVTGYFRERIRWDKFVAHQEQWKDRMVVGPVARESLLGPTLPGDARADYDEALMDLVATGGSATTIQHIAAGVRKSKCSFDPVFNGDKMSRMEWLLGIGFPRGLEGATTKAQFGADMAGMPRVFAVGLTFIHDALHEIVSIAQDPATSPEVLDRIEAIVAGMERTYPSMATVMDRTGCLLGGELLKAGAPAIRWTWKPLFFDRDPACFEFAEMWPAYVDLLRRGESMEWAPFESAYESCLARMRGRGGMSFWDVGEYHHAPRSWRQGLVHIRTVRAALMARRGLRPGAAGWPVNPVTLKPVAWDDATREAGCDEMNRIYFDLSAACWLRGRSMVVRIR